MYVYLRQMVDWHPKRLTTDLRRYTKKRLGLDGLCFWDIPFDIRAEEENGNKLVVISINPPQKKIEGLLGYLKHEVKTEWIFEEDRELGFMRSRREFSKYPERLEYADFKENGKGNVFIIYRVKPPLLNLGRESFRDTIYSYAVSPIINWIQRRSLHNK